MRPVRPLRSGASGAQPHEDAADAAGAAVEEWGQLNSARYQVVSWEQSV
ncbi:hypothetical protein LAUMK35_04007 [Mycobacterium pseudokansasii]|nr:hypothetical protein LAUMK35_04007 [Mycobacterium pseudokansasii]VAZ99871.1 hypothetical protein LAUMK21_04003 [Mycobacterium pseudokansasii]